MPRISKHPIFSKHDTEEPFPALDSVSPFINMSYATVPTGASLDPKRFDLSIPDEQIKDFKQLLQLSKVGPETYENLQQDRSLGLNRQWFLEAKEYWEGKYDW